MHVRLQLNKQVRGWRPLQEHVLDFDLAAPRSAARGLCAGVLLQRLQGTQHACNGDDSEQCFLRPEATIVGSSASSSVSVVFELYQRGGSVALATTKVSSVTITPGVATLVTGSEMSCNNTELWTVARPFLHTIVATISDGATVTDVVNVTVGLRQQHWDPVSHFRSLMCGFFCMLLIAC